MTTTEAGFWNEESDVSAFALPGDDALTAALTGAAEETAPADSEESADAATTERARDEKGRFASAPETDAAEMETESASAEAVTEPELILGKFKSQEELGRAAGELERHYEELERKIGPLRQELGDVRKELQQVVQQTAPQPQQHNIEAIQDHFAENPTSILPTIQQAYNANDRTLVYLGIKALEDVDPVLAEGLRVEVAKRDAITEMQEQMRPATALAENADLQDRARNLADRYPDIGEFIASADLAGLAEQFPLAKRAITEGSVEDRFSAIESLYLIHRGRATDNLKDTTREVARQTAEQAAALREEGFVASATQTAGSSKSSPAKLLEEQWDNQDAALEEGWKVGRV